MSDVQPALVRQWRLLRQLSARPEGLSLRELAREVEVSQKTIHRDLQLFQRAGFPLHEIVGSHGVKHWRIGPPGGEIPLGFTFDEALAMYLGWQSLQPLGGTLIAEAAERAFRKLRASFGPRVVRYLDKMRGLLYDTQFGVTDYGPHAEILDQLSPRSRPFGAFCVRCSAMAVAADENDMEPRQVSLKGATQAGKV